jgi:hypothetical protein
MSFIPGSEPTVSRTGYSRKRRPASRHAVQQVKRQNRRLFLEQLEDRRLMAIMLDGIPSWVEQGPGPIHDGNNVTGIPDRPQVGAVEAIAVDPSDPAHIFLATVNGGIWVSHNATAATPDWTPLTDNFRSNSFSAIIFDPSDPTHQTVWAAYGRVSSGGGDGEPTFGLIRTTNDGAQWTDVGNGPGGVNLDPFTYRSIAPTSVLDPGTNQQIVMAAPINGPGLFRSINGGLSFTNISDGAANHLPAGSPGQIVADPTNNQRFYVSIPGTGVFRTSDAGATWTAINTGLTLATDGLDNDNDGTSDEADENVTGANRIELSVGAGGSLFAALMHPIVVGTEAVPGKTRLIGVFHSANNGTTWSVVGTAPQVSDGGQGGTHMAVVADPTDGDKVYVSGDRGPGASNGNKGNAFRGSVAGNSWTELDAGGAPSTSPHPDSRDMQFAGGDLLQSNDGGIYRLVHPNGGGTPEWSSMLGNLRNTEFYSVAFDSLNNVIFGGTQDNGSPEQSANGNFTWNDKTGADGGFSAVDNSNPGFSIHYGSEQGLGGFLRQNFASPGNVAGAVHDITLNVNGAGGGDLFDVEESVTPGAGNEETEDGEAALPSNPTTQFIQPYVVNAVDPTRMLIGTNFLYESTNRGDDLVSLGGLQDLTGNGLDDDSDGATDEGDEYRPINSLGTTTAMAYGGTFQNVANADFTLVGTTGFGGNTLFLRTTNSTNTVADFAGLGAYVGGVPQDIVIDPANDHQFFVLDKNGRVFQTTDMGVTFTNITGNLALFSADLRTIEFYNGPGVPNVLVGGLNGVFTSQLGSSTWGGYGVNLPGVLVKDLHYLAPDANVNTTDDVLLAGTWGRGALTISNVSFTINATGVLNICGDEDYLNEDDTIRVVRDPLNNLLLDVFLNNTTSVPTFSIPLSLIDQINVFAAGGNDTLIVDSTNGLINVPNGIRYDGDHACPGFEVPGAIGGFDRLDLVQTGGSAVGIVDVIAIGNTNGSGRSTITNGTITQRVDFQYLEPVVDSVPAASFSITSIPGLASLLQGDNAINYSAALLIPPPAATIGGRVTVDAFEPIEFTGKTNLIIDAGSGSDVINLNNPLTPTGLASITINGGDPTDSDTLIINDRAATSDQIRLAPTSQGAGNLTGNGVPQSFTGIEKIRAVLAQNAQDYFTVDGTTGDDHYRVTSGVANGAMRITGEFNQNGIAFTLPTIDVSGASSSVVGNFNFNGAGGTDTFSLTGTTFNDSFTIAGSGGTTGAINHLINGVQTNFFGISNFTTVNVDGLDGDDVFNAAASIPFALNINGGNPSSGSDVLNFGGAGGAITVELGLNSIQEAAFSPVTYTGVERVNIQSANLTSSLTVNGTVGEEILNFKMSGGGQGTFTAVSDGQFVATYPVFTYLVAAASVLKINTQGGNDTLGLIATTGNDVINVIQSGANTLSYSQNTFTQAFNVSNLDLVEIDALAGDDLIRVSVSDTLIANPNNSLAFSVDGGPPNASDRLIVDDAGIGDLTIIRQAPDQRSGSVTVGTLNPVYYSDVERLDVTPVNSVTGGTGTDGNGRIEVFHTDPFEFNETRLTAATLSRVRESATPPTIDPGAVVAPFAVPGDEDWYDFRPQATGTFSVKILFETQPTLANGRAGLPGNGDLNLDIYDANGALIVSGVAAPGGKAAVFGATNDPAFPQFNHIYVRVHGTTPNSVNHYEFDNLDAVGTGNPGVGNADLFGPQVTDVLANSIPSAIYNLFGEKPANTVFHPTPLVKSLTIQLKDLPARAPGFLYPAIDPITALTQGTYVVRGDATGIAALRAVNPIILTNDPTVVGGVPTASIQIFFAQPLPDDRFTLVVNDNLLDPAGNKLDGESNAAEPNGAPHFPSGDTHAGNPFIARFTVDTRAELGSGAAGSVYIDTNGNNTFDPTNADSSDRDITYLMGFASDNIFAGNFAKTPLLADGFDKLAAFGKVGTNYRWLIDTNNDGIADVNVNQPLLAGVTNLSGMPAAGNFDGNAANGDEVALKVGTTWFLETLPVHNFTVDKKLPGTTMPGLPIVGDFDGDGKEDLGSWDADKFYIDFGSNGLTGNSEFSFGFGFISVRERPVAADFDGDGITDLGLWVPDRAGAAPSESAEWYLLISNGQSLQARNADPTRGMAFKPSPFGSDLFAQFGDEFGLPIVGNFDPPITPAQPTGSFTNSRDRADVDNDGNVSPIDALLIINKLNSGDTSLASTPFARAPFVDVDGDGTLAPIDALLVINRLNAPSSSDSSGEGEAADAFFGSLGSRPSSDSSLSALLAVDDYFSNRKK